MSAIASKSGTSVTPTEGTAKELSSTRKEEGTSPLPQSNFERQIRLRAYELYQTRCCNGRAGNAMADWLQAEVEVKNGQRHQHLGNSEFKYTPRGEVLLASGG